MLAFTAHGLDVEEKHGGPEFAATRILQLKAAHPEGRRPAASFEVSGQARGGSRNGELTLHDPEAKPKHWGECTLLTSPAPSAQAPAAWGLTRPPVAGFNPPGDREVREREGKAVDQSPFGNRNVNIGSLCGQNNAKLPVRCRSCLSVCRPSSPAS